MHSNAIAECLWDTVIETDRRSVRVGGCPVLSVFVSYPRLLPAATDAMMSDEVTAAVERFNCTYRTAADCFVSWALNVPAAEAIAAFEAAGSGAAYRFARWELTFEAAPVWDEDRTVLRVITTATWHVRREADARKTAREIDSWRLRSLSLEKSAKKEKHQRKICAKALEKGKKTWYNKI